MRAFEIYQGPLRNPERGLVQSIDITDPDDVAFVQAQGVTLGFAQISLAGFRARPVSDSFLAEMRAGLENVRRAGLKLVLRFHYDTDQGRDTTLERVLQHIDQLEPILRENSDVIAVLQAGFVGAWGEWHSSQHGLGTETSRFKILARLLEVLPDNRKLQVRSPVFKEQALRHGGTIPGGPLAAQRIGYHNDCLLADKTDGGTYPQPVEKWRQYVDSDRSDLPVGGETCKQNAPRTNCGNAIFELRQQRWSFVNRTYHPEVIASWQEQGCLGVIDRDLGYRFAIKTVHVSPTLAAGSSEALRVEIENLGYAVPYNPRPVFAVLSGPSARFAIALTSWDPREWDTEGVKVLEAMLAIPRSAPKGVYALSLWLPDAADSLRHRPEYAIRLANEEMWEREAGLNYLGEVTVE